MPTLRLFAGAKQAAGTGEISLPGTTVGEVLAAARATFGASFEAVLPDCKVWLNGEPAGDADAVGSEDEVAVLPPVSGGC